ncbi:MAG: hypothetical protein JSV80_18425 [Acidobacteriota bacterium]|nr:MAG: hypothetical protein JSV80_18425 [Acidobacteriota bacterium]
MILAMTAAAIPHPDPLPLPAPPGLIWMLLLLTFLLHLLPMNLVLGGSILAPLSRLRSTGVRGAHHRQLLKVLSKAMPSAVAAAITLGVAPLLLAQVLYGRLFFTSSILMAWFWLAVIPLLVIGYYGTYLIAFKGEALGSLRELTGWLVALVFLAIAFIYTNNMSLMLRPAEFVSRYHESGRGLQLNLGDPTLAPRFLHMLLGALAVSGMVVAIYGLLRRSRDAAFGAWAVRYGSLWFSVATAANLMVGVWWLIALPRESMLRFMGQNLLATISLGAGILFALGTLILTLLAVQAPRPERLAQGGVVTLLLTLIAMILVRDQVRQGALARAGFEPVAWIAPQWGPLVLFLLLLVGAIGTVVWMVVALARESAA